MRFIRSLKGFLLTLFRLDYPRKLDSSDFVARVVKSSTQMKKKSKFHQAFMPHKSTLSVFTIGGLSESDIWENSKRIAAISNNKCHGRGDLLVENIHSIGLSIDLDNKPKRHANIIGWPPPDEKSTIMLYAKKLAASANRLYCPNS